MKFAKTISLEVTQEELAMIVNALVDSMLPSRRVQDLVKRIVQASNPTPKPPAEEAPK